MCNDVEELMFLKNELVFKFDFGSPGKQRILWLIFIRVAQFPEELVTYGGNGQVLANWAQFRIVLNYLANMTGIS